jgi:hypothetical protein
MNTSGVRLGQYFQRLTSDLGNVLYNLIPMSFVYDWFTSEYSGALDLNERVYMPVGSHKLVISYNLETYLTCTHTDILKHTLTAKWWYYRYWRDLHRDVLHTYLEDTWVQMPYKYVPKEQYKYEESGTSTEHLKYYVRKVYENPLRRTTFPPEGTFGIDCFDTKTGPLSDGQATTLGALLWGFAPR